MLDELNRKVDPEKLKSFCDETSAELVRLVAEKVESFGVSEMEGLNIVSNVFAVATAKTGFLLSEVDGIQGMRLTKTQTYNRLREISKVMFEAIQHNIFALYENSTKAKKSVIEQ